MGILWRAKIGRQLLLAYAHAGFAAAYIHCGLAANGGCFALQLPYARFMGITAYQFNYRFIRYGKLAFLQPVLFKLLGDKVTLGYFHLFGFKVTAQLYYFHSVQKRAGDGVLIVCRGYEHDLGQIVFLLQKMIAEGEILCAVQYLQHGCGGVAAHVRGKLVYLVKKQQRIYAARLAHCGDNTARHCAYVCAPMAAYLGLVMYAAEAHPHKVAPKRPCNAGCNACFANARRAYKADYLPVHFARKARNCNVLQYALLHLFHAVMVVIKYCAGVLNVQIILGFFAPRQIEHAFYIVAHGRLLVRCGGQVAKARYLALQLFAHGLRHLLFLKPAHVFFCFVLLGFAKLLAYGLYLLVQIIFALVLVHAALHFCGDALIKLCYFNFAHYARKHDFQPFFNAYCVQRGLAHV